MAVGVHQSGMRKVRIDAKGGEKLQIVLAEQIARFDGHLRNKMRCGLDRGEFGGERTANGVALKLRYFADAFAHLPIDLLIDGGKKINQTNQTADDQNQKGAQAVR